MTEALAYVVLPRLHVRNANLISSPLTWGFPSPSAFTGFGYALQRRLNSQGHELTISGVGVSCHAFTPQVSEGFVKSLRLTRPPLEPDGKPPGTVEEGRCDMTISLVLEVRGDLPPTEAELRYVDAFPQQMLRLTGGMRIAGGSVTLEQPHAWSWLDTGDADQRGVLRAVVRRLLPGRVLVARNDVLAEHLERMRHGMTEATALDALLDLIAVHHEATDTGKVSKSGVPEAQWRSARRLPGWLVPIPVGYGAISPLYPPASVQNVRDRSVPFRFVESLLGLGEWLHPRRATSLHELLWRHHTDLDRGLYRWGMRDEFPSTP